MSYNGIPGDLNKIIELLTTETPNHADIFNNLFKQMVDNDAELEKRINDSIQEIDGVVKKQLDTHISDKNNPHNITPSQIGAETPAGAQSKADKAKNDTVNWVKSLGLGSFAKNIKDFNAIEESGIYEAGEDALNTPNGKGYYAIFISMRGAGGGSQLAIQRFSNSSSKVFVRSVYSGNFGDWQEIETTTGAQQKVDNHANKKDNPHNVTKNQIGLGNVDNIKQETPSGAQEKANKALADAKSYSMNMVASGSTSDPNTTQESYILTNHANSPGRSTYWHIQTYFYSSKTGNRAQLAISYSLATPLIYIRQYYSSTGWTAWRELSGLEDLNKHANNKNNPHGVTKSQVGLGSVANYGIASDSEAVEGTSNTKYMTPLRTKEHVDPKLNTLEQTIKALIQAHTKDKGNPHDVTSEQITVIPAKSASASGNDYPRGTTMFSSTDGQGYPQTYGVVINFKINDSRFTQWFFGNGFVESQEKVFYRMWHSTNGWTDWHEQETVEGSQAKVDKHANNKSNPHGVTKSQVGLGSVSNYGISTQAEAEAGTSNSKYMTPLRTKQAIDKHARGALRIFVQSSTPSNPQDGDIWIW